MAAISVQPEWNKLVDCAAYRQARVLPGEIVVTSRWWSGSVPVDIFVRPNVKDPKGVNLF